MKNDKILIKMFYFSYINNIEKIDTNEFSKEMKKNIYSYPKMASFLQL